MFRQFQSVTLVVAFIFNLNISNAQISYPVVKAGSDNMLLASMEQSIDYSDDTIGFFPNSLTNYEYNTYGDPELTKYYAWSSSDQAYYEMSNFETFEYSENQQLIIYKDEDRTTTYSYNYCLLPEETQTSFSNDTIVEKHDLYYDEMCRLIVDKKTLFSPNWEATAETEFIYDGDKLISSYFYPMINYQGALEISTHYYYNAEGMCVGDSSFERDQGELTWISLRYHHYTYSGNLLSTAVEGRYNSSLDIYSNYSRNTWYYDSSDHLIENTIEDCLTDDNVFYPYLKYIYNYNAEGLLETSISYHHTGLNDWFAESIRTYYYMPKPQNIPEQTTISVFPNPATHISYINLISDHEDEVQFTLYNITGKKIFQSDFIPITYGKNQIPLYLYNNAEPAISSGSYFLIIEGAHKYPTTQIIVL